MLEQVKKALELRGYAVHIFETAEQAKEHLLADIAPDKSVGFGGSMTLKNMGLDQALVERGNPFFWHWTAEDKEGAQIAAAVADVYLVSANAVTKKGQIINIDGHGNRVAATIHGPGKVIFIIGKNKIAEDYDAAMERIHTVACPGNARRLGLSTPCAITGKCADCASPQRMCNATVVFERAPSGHPFEILLINEDLGY